jgi:ribonuclease Z
MLLRVSDIFVSHTHMDHFAGFDHLLRVALGRDTGVRLYGPEPFVSQVEHKLAAYTWNLVHNYATDFVIEAHELTTDGCVRSARFRSRERFNREPLPDSFAAAGVLLEDDQFRVRALPLEHHDIVSLAFSFEEHTHINVWKSRLEEQQLPSGPWLTELKKQVRSGAPDDTPIRIRWRTRTGPAERLLPLGQLKRQILEFEPGQKICYVTDAAGHERNRTRITEFVRNADLLFIEAVFVAADEELAMRKAHLTTTQAGEIARAAAVRKAEPFHFSTRYYDNETVHREEFARARRGPTSVCPPILKSPAGHD